MTSGLWLACGLVLALLAGGWYLIRLSAKATERDIAQDALEKAVEGRKIDDAVSGLDDDSLDERLREKP